MWLMMLQNKLCWRDLINYYFRFLTNIYVHLKTKRHVLDPRFYMKNAQNHLKVTDCTVLGWMKTSASAVLWSFDHIELVSLQRIYLQTWDIEKTGYLFEVCPFLQMCTKGLVDIEAWNTTPSTEKVRSLHFGFWLALLQAWSKMCANQIIIATVIAEW